MSRWGIILGKNRRTLKKHGMKQRLEGKNKSGRCPSVPRWDELRQGFCLQERRARRNCLFSKDYRGVPGTIYNTVILTARQYSYKKRQWTWIK